MENNIEALKQELAKASLEEQKEILEKFMVANTDERVLEGIRIANESLMTVGHDYIISSHVKE